MHFKSSFFHQTFANACRLIIPKFNEVVDNLDIASALDIIQEAANADLPLSSGRD
jgi:hypothetical protein